MHLRCTVLFPAEQQPEAAARKTTAEQGQGRTVPRQSIDCSNRLTAEAIGKPRRRQPRVPEAPWVKFPAPDSAALHRVDPHRTVIPPLGGGHPVFTPARD